MLAGEPVPAIGGNGVQLQAQVEALGWRIDDLLMTAADRAGNLGRLAISAKGNQQVSATALPADFVLRAWEQWRDPQTPMNRKKDGLALVTQWTNAEFISAWSEVKNACSGGDVLLSISRIRSNNRQSRIFDSVRKPRNRTFERSDQETVELIRHLHVLPVDFQLDHSESESQAIAQCRQLLVSGTLEEARALWRSLIWVATDVRIRRGTITLDELWSYLCRQFRMRHRPDFGRDWETLSNLTADYKSRIEGELPSGRKVLRRERTALENAISSSRVTVVFGESGAGKSALVKDLLDERFADRTHVWLGPEELKTALSAARRHTLPLQHDLGRVLKASIDSRNILVLDSTERIEAAELGAIRQLMQSLFSTSAEVEDWRVVVITQTQNWVEGATTMFGNARAALVEVELLKALDVKSALKATPSLSWLVNHDDTIAALTNLRALAWIIEAGPTIGSNADGLTSHTAVADRMWDYWTAGAADVQALMMRLAQREASFERSFALTDLDPSHSSTFSRRPSQLPLRLNARTNRIEFEHDLAADWARFQFLKQVAHDPGRWLALAENPLWTSALRMLGQFLLRQPVGSATAWDDAFAAAEAADLPLANDILLDAICLDPEAQRLLSERTEFLFEDNERRFTRLLIRFHHIATVPAAGRAEMTSALGLYIEAQYRSVIYGRWPPVLQFLISQKDRIVGLISTPMARLAQTWLNGTPQQTSGGAPFPFRRDVAKIALGMARAIQVMKGHGVMFLANEPVLYTAPFAGAADLPNEVAAWALELAGRREIASDVMQRVNEVRRRQAAEHRQRLQSDPEYKARHERLLGTSTGIHAQKLPPWPLGAKRKVDHSFRTACLNSNCLVPLMQARPEVAAEVLLALIIEDEPRHDYRSRVEIDLGIEYSTDAYPTAFWKSPFFQFLQVAPQLALTSLIALVNFSTQRWVEQVPKGNNDSAPRLELQFEGGVTKRYGGRAQVFRWVQNSSHSHGALFCALDALERWLILQLELGADITKHIRQLLRDSWSTAILSLLVNVAKFRPSLLTEALAPLLSQPYLFYWDIGRVRGVDSNFVGWAWVQQGETILEIAKAWTLASHRKRTLVDVTVDLLKTDAKFAERLQALLANWIPPEDAATALEFKAIFAALDRDNYMSKTDPESGAASLVLAYPQELVQQVSQWREKNAKPLQYLMLPSQCERQLQSQTTITEDSAAQLYDLLQSCEADTDVELDVKRTFKVALAATLIVAGNTWLSTKPRATDLVKSIVRETIVHSGITAEDIRKRRIRSASDELKFAAYAAMHLWVNHEETAQQWEGLVLRLLTSGDDRAAGTIFALAHVYRDRLGSAFWRLQLAGVLWSGLVLLSPQYFDDQLAERVWPVWLARLRRFPLRWSGASAADLKLDRIADGCERLEFVRRLRAYDAGDKHWRGKPERQRGIALDTGYLGVVFNWILNGPGTGVWIEDSQLVCKLWAYEVGRAKARAKDEGEYDLPSQMLGYDLLAKLASMSLEAPNGAARAVWEPVLSQGPDAHYALQQFVRSLFLQLSNKQHFDRFETIWREMVEYGLAAKWHKGRYWFYGERTLCDLLGFGNEVTLGHLPSGAALRMRDVYARWAKNHLARDEDCVARFAHFLVTEFGAPLRLDGLRWIAATLKQGANSWYRERSGNALVELVNVSLAQSARELTNQSDARQALVEIAAGLAARNVPAALALQERIKLLR